MADVDREFLDRVGRFLDRFGDTQSPVCMDCLTEFSEGVQRCSDCHALLAAGPVAVAELRALLARGRDGRRVAAWRSHNQERREHERAAAEHAQGQPEEEGPELAEGEACPRCGTPFDPDVDVEGCENCRQLELNESEALAEDIEPEPDEIETVERFRRFLAHESDPASSYCPGCLNEFRSDATACVRCTKELLSAEDARRFARRSVEDLTAHWFVPVTDDADAVFSEALWAALEADEEAPQIEVRVKRLSRGFSPIFAVWRYYRTEYYVRRSQLTSLRRWVAGAPLEERFSAQRETLIAHLDRLLLP